MLLVTRSCKLNVTVTLFEQKRNPSPTALCFKGKIPGFMLGSE